MKLVVKYFLLADILGLGAIFRFWSEYFPLAGMFYLGCCLGLKFCCIQVNMVRTCF